MLNIPFHKSTDILPKDKQYIIWLETKHYFDSFSIDFKHANVSYDWECLDGSNPDSMTDEELSNDPNFKLILLDENGFEFDDVFYWIDTDEFYRISAAALGIELED